LLIKVQVNAAGLKVIAYRNAEAYAKWAGKSKRSQTCSEN
jgi:hypothetical protein